MPLLVQKTLNAVPTIPITASLFHAAQQVVLLLPPVTMPPLVKKTLNAVPTIPITASLFHAAQQVVHQVVLLLPPVTMPNLVQNFPNVVKAATLRNASACHAVQPHQAVPVQVP